MLKFNLNLKNKSSLNNYLCVFKTDKDPRIKKNYLSSSSSLMVY